MTCTAPICPPRHRRTERRVLLLAALLPMLLSAPAWALRSDRQQPMQVNAQRFNADQSQHITHLYGNVVMTQGSLRGSADTATVYTDAANKITRIVLDGGPARLQQQLDGGGQMHAHAQTIDYTPADDTAVLVGDAHVDQQGRGSFAGARLVYNTQSGAMQGEGGNGGEVHLTFQPRDKTAAPAPAGSAHGSH